MRIRVNLTPISIDANSTGAATLGWATLISPDDLPSDNYVGGVPTALYAPSRGGH